MQAGVLIQHDVLTTERAVFILVAAIGGVLLLVGPWVFGLGRRYERRTVEREVAEFERHVATTPVPIFPPGRVPRPHLTEDARLILAGRAAQVRSFWPAGSSLRPEWAGDDVITRTGEFHADADDLPSHRDPGVVTDPDHD